MHFLLLTFGNTLNQRVVGNVTHLKISLLKVSGLQKKTENFLTKEGVKDSSPSYAYQKCGSPQSLRMVGIFSVGSKKKFRNLTDWSFQNLGMNDRRCGFTNGVTVPKFSPTAPDGNKINGVILPNSALLAFFLEWEWEFLPTSVFFWIEMSPVQFVRILIGGMTSTTVCM